MSVAATPPPEPGRPSPWRWWVCGLLFLATTLNYMDRMALNQTALRIQTSLGIDDEEYSYLEGAFSAAFAVGAVATGFVVDRVNVRWVYPVMVAGWSLTGVLTGFASTFWALLSCRLLLGLFEAGNWPCGIRTTRTVLRPAERSLGNSLFQSGTAVGAILTPLAMPALLLWADPLEPQRNATMAVVGGVHAAVSGAPALSWQVPFRIIGCLGFVWIALWFVTVPGRMLTAATPAPGAAPDAGATRFADVFRDRRFWVLFAMAVAVNVTWHGYRTWLPLYLQRGRGFSERQMNDFTAVYYLTADVGSWCVGFLTLALARGRFGLHGGRVISYGLCSLLALQTLAVPFLPDGWPLKAALLVVAFGALGLFPTYFALTQELSAKHQGKVTGVLGAGAHLSLAVIYPVEGRIIRLTGSYELVLGAIGVFPLLVLALVFWHWPPRREKTSATP